MSMSNVNLVTRYGGEALEKLREAQPLLKATAALSRLENRPWTLQVEEWERLLSSLVALIEDTPLTAKTEQVGFRPKVMVKETLEDAMRQRRKVCLCVERKDGTIEDVGYEPYSFRVSPREGEMLFAYNVEHAHLERIPLWRIRYIIGVGDEFEPRWDVELDNQTIHPQQRP